MQFAVDKTLEFLDDPVFLVHLFENDGDHIAFRLAIITVHEIRTKRHCGTLDFRWRWRSVIPLFEHRMDWSICWEFSCSDHQSNVLEICYLSLHLIGGLCWCYVQR